MEVKFYKTVSPNNMVVKELTDEKSISGNLRSEISYHNPVISFSTAIKDFNYCFIPEFGRYYYIDDIRFLKNNYEVYLHCDVLMTYKDEILKMKALIYKAENPIAEYVDGDFTVDARSNIQVIQYPVGFVTEEYVLVTMKGGDNIG